MILETVEAKGLAHLSYLVGDEGAGLAAVIDPRRDVEEYLRLARRHGVRIAAIFETHIHADFLSGSLELAARCGAPVHVGAAEGYGFEHIPLRGGEEFAFGAVRFRALATPGHTPEHMCFLVSGGKGAGEPWGLFSGDLLFAGEVGRPDLLGEAERLRLAAALRRSLHDVALVLPDGIEVYPAHGVGSPCGGSIGDRKTTTIGYERANNPKLAPMSEEDFVSLVLGDLPPPPRYYPRMKRDNLVGAPHIGSHADAPALSAEDVRRMAANVQIVDVREIEAFGGGHIPGALNIPLRAEFPVWAGWMLDPDRPVVLVAPSIEADEEARTHLLRIGVDRIVGTLRPGMRGWFEAGFPFDRILQMSVHELHRSLGEVCLLDVRTPGEWEGGTIRGARRVYAPFVEAEIEGHAERNEPIAVYCGSGYRSSVAVSVLRRMGYLDVRNVPGGIKAWRAAGLPVEPAGYGTRELAAVR